MNILILQTAIFCGGIFMDINALYNEWLEKADADPDLKVELESIK